MQRDDRSPLGDNHPDPSERTSLTATSIRTTQSSPLPGRCYFSWGTGEARLTTAPTDPERPGCTAQATSRGGPGTCGNVGSPMGLRSTSSAG